MQPPEQNEHQQHVVIMAPNWLGDAIMAQPAMVALSRHLQPASITLTGRAWLAELLPFMGINGAVFHPDLPTDADMAILFPNSFRAAWQAWRTGIPARAGFAGQWRSLLLTTPLRPNVDMKTEHHRHYYLDLAEQLGAAISDPEVRLSMPEAEVAAGKHIIMAHDIDVERAICVAPGAQFGSAKRYPAEGYARILAELAEHGWQPILVGTHAERDICAACARDLRGKTYWNAAGDTSLRTALQLLAATRMLLCNDSGLMHVAAGMGKPVVAMFGATDPARTAPSGPKVRWLYHPASCSPCLQRECSTPGQPCMANISPEAVIAACTEALH